ncbi:hypothetical protein LTR53_020496, partial [Teratosphaeriaceae sp. CCFEE 6253]
RHRPAGLQRALQHRRRSPLPVPPLRLAGRCLPPRPALRLRAGHRQELVRRRRVERQQLQRPKHEPDGLRAGRRHRRPARP